MQVKRRLNVLVSLSNVLANRNYSMTWPSILNYRTKIGHSRPLFSCQPLQSGFARSQQGPEIRAGSSQLRLRWPAQGFQCRSGISLRGEDQGLQWQPGPASFTEALTSKAINMGMLLLGDNQRHGVKRHCTHRLKGMRG